MRVTKYIGLEPDTRAERTGSQKKWEETAMLVKALSGLALAFALSLATAQAADVTVRMLHVNETGDPYWKKIAEDYNATHKGVKVIVDYMENEAYKRSEERRVGKECR